MKKKKSDMTRDSRTDTFERVDKIIKYTKIYIVIYVIVVTLLITAWVYCKLKGI